MAIMQHKPNRPEDALTAMDRVIWKMAHKYARNHRARDLDDLYMDGVEGLMKAYHCFDATKGRAFSSHAYQWIWAHIKDRALGKYATYNITSGAAFEDHNLGTYTMPLEDLVDANAMADRMSPTVKAIHKARAQGYNYREISEAMESLGKSMTLHQVRNMHLKALEA